MTTIQRLPTTRLPWGCQTKDKANLRGKGRAVLQECGEPVRLIHKDDCGRARWIVNGAWDESCDCDWLNCQGLWYLYASSVSLVVVPGCWVGVVVYFFTLSHPVDVDMNTHAWRLLPPLEQTCAPMTSDSQVPAGMFFLHTRLGNKHTHTHTLVK